MKVVVAPDKFAGTLTASQAARAISAGWVTFRPADDVVLVPMSDGGPGFVDVLSAALVASTRRPVSTTDPLGRPLVAEFLLHEQTAYVESAQAVGLHLLAEGERDPERTSSAGLAALLAEAVEAGVDRIVVGLGGSATNDGGRGMIEALQGRHGKAHPKSPGLIAELRDVTLVTASDVDNPLLGLTGASAVFAPQKGAGPEAVARLETRMTEWVDQLPGLRAVARVPGAGAAGGLGAALFWLGASRVPGADLVAGVVGLTEAIAAADLVITGEGAYDFTSLRGKVVATVAAAAQQAGLPCALVAGQVSVGEREAAAHGVDELVALTDVAGSVASAMADPLRWLGAVGAQMARRWGTA